MTGRGRCAPCAQTASPGAGTPAEGGKLAEPSFADWMTLADYTLVEADGSKGLPAQGPHAPARAQ